MPYTATETHVFIEPEYRGITFRVLVEGELRKGGSDRYGTDEPSWIEAEINSFHRPNGGGISKRLASWLGDNCSQLAMQTMIGE